MLLVIVLECDMEDQDKPITTFLRRFAEKYEVFPGKEKIVA